MFNRSTAAIRLWLVNRLLRHADRARDTKQWPKAAISYRRALRLSPCAGQIWVQYGHALKESGALKAAIAAYRRGVRLQEGDFDAWLQLGHGLKLQRKIGAAAHAYTRAFKLNPECGEAEEELALLGRHPCFEDIKKYVGMPVGGAEECWKRAVVLDVTDLFSFFCANQRPSGIQRVQIELVKSVSCSKRHLVVFCDEQSAWIRVPDRLVSLIANELTGSATALVADKNILRLFAKAVGHVFPKLEFGTHSALITLGGAWTNERYLSAVRSFKDKEGAKYITLLYDLIPVLMPGTCAPGVSQQFEKWMLEAIHIVDHWICVSKTTAVELEALSARVLGRRVRCQVITLAARTVLTNTPIVRMEGFRAERGKFVLCVSTFEPRKNHLAAFEAWKTMLAVHENVPLLVCVGRLGWEYSPALRYLKEHPEVAQHVVLLHAASDTELDFLYRNCLATLYPSSGEGWGLPITESLCYGKIPVCGNSPALLESSETLALHIDTQDPTSIAHAVARLTQDRNFRMGLETRIRTEFRARSWSEIAEEICIAALAINPSEACAGAI
jgi:glycosyltransferase involved in cell wall biosynthesis